MAFAPEIPGLLAPFAWAAAGAFGAFLLLRRARSRSAPAVTAHIIAQRVRALRSLVGLEVSVKEIATAASGPAFLPPALLSRARVAMIFHFELQYAVDLAGLDARSVRRVAPGRYRLLLPPVAESLRLVDVVPYDIQAGRVLGLLDVLPVTAERQAELMRRAQAQARSIELAGQQRYRDAARLSIERTLESLLGLFSVDVEVEWGEASPAPAEPEPLAASAA
jgi:hypothetical protein